MNETLPLIPNQMLKLNRSCECVTDECLCMCGGVQLTPRNVIYPNANRHSLRPYAIDEQNCDCVLPIVIIHKQINNRPHSMFGISARRAHIMRLYWSIGLCKVNRVLHNCVCLCAFNISFTTQYTYDWHHQFNRTMLTKYFINCYKTTIIMHFNSNRLKFFGTVNISLKILVFSSKNVQRNTFILHSAQRTEFKTDKKHLP